MTDSDALPEFPMFERALGADKLPVLRALVDTRRRYHLDPK
jgi:hypothetical protein